MILTAFLFFHTMYISVYIHTDTTQLHWNDYLNDKLRVHKRPYANVHANTCSFLIFILQVNQVVHYYLSF